MIAMGIGGLAVLMAVALAVAVARTSGRRTAGWFSVLLILVLAAQWRIAASGSLKVWDQRPAPLMLFIGGCTILTTITAFSRIGTRLVEDLPFAVLIGAQAFRLPLELLMHQAAETGVMPVVMSYSGRNFDIVTGISAIAVAFLAARGQAPRSLLIRWNLLGSILLGTIVTIAVLASPLFRYFGDAQLNTWVTDPPYVWLPGILVQAALLGHLLIWRKLFKRSS